MDYKYFPKTKKELTDAIRAEIKRQGYRADLNCINTSAITNMYELFSKFRTFDGDISRWDVSHVTNMARMFAESHFDGDIGAWDVSRVEDMTEMFYFSRFRGDISGWDVHNVTSYHPMFHYSSLREENKPIRFQKRTMGCDEFLSVLPEVLDGVSDMVSASVKILSECHLVREKTDPAPKDTLVYRLTDGAVAVSLAKGQFAYGRYKGIVDGGEYEFLDGKTFNYAISGEGVLRISGNLDSDLSYSFHHDGLDLPTESFFDRLVIEEGTMRIGKRMFDNWKWLKEVSLPKSLQVLGAESFSGCIGLSALNLRSGLLKIGNGAFSHCPNITEIKFPKALKSIGDYSFRNCKSLEHIEFPPHLESIGKEAFSGCDKLVDVKLPGSLKNLSPSAFDSRSFELGPVTFTVENYATSCNSAIVRSVDDDVVGSLVIPSEVEYEGRVVQVTGLGEYAFGECKNLREVWLPDSIKVIPYEAFIDCKRMRRVHFGKNTKAIETKAFCGCNRLREIELPDSVEVIGPYAFQECGNLIIINRPAALKEVHSTAFVNSSVMDNGSGTRYLGDILMRYISYMPPRTVLEVRKGTTLIASEALSSESRLSGVVLPSTVRYIGRKAFNTKRPVVVDVPWKKPIPIGESAFDSRSTIRVPKGCLERYKGDPSWSIYQLEEK